MDYIRLSLERMILQKTFNKQSYKKLLVLHNFE
jgi:hypothetical protein